MSVDRNRNLYCIMIFVDVALFCYHFCRRSCSCCFVVAVVANVVMPCMLLFHLLSCFFFFISLFYVLSALNLGTYLDINKNLEMI